MNESPLLELKLWESRDHVLNNVVFHLLVKTGSSESPEKCPLCRIRSLDFLSRQIEQGLHILTYQLITTCPSLPSSPNLSCQSFPTTASQPRVSATEAPPWVSEATWSSPLSNSHQGEPHGIRVGEDAQVQGDRRFTDTAMLSLAWKVCILQPG